MSYTDKGVLVFDEWFRAMERLGAYDYKKLMHAVYRYQLYGEEPPEFKGKAAIVADMMFPYIARRLAQAKGGKRSAEKRGGSCSGNPIIDDILKSRGINQ